MDSEQKRERRRELRKSPTMPEVILWKYLKNYSFRGLKFRRQHCIGPYFIDFYCHPLRLAVELDGESHYTEQGREHDRIRDSYLTEQGINTLRITNHDLHVNQEGTFIRLAQVIESLQAAEE